MNNAYKVVPLSMLFPGVQPGVSATVPVQSVELKQGEFGHEIVVSSGQPALRVLCVEVIRAQVINDRVHIEVPSNGLKDSVLASWEDSTALQSAPRENDAFAEEPKEAPKDWVYEDMPDCIQESVDFLAGVVRDRKNIGEEIRLGHGPKPCPPCALLMLMEAEALGRLVRSRIK